MQKDNEKQKDFLWVEVKSVTLSIRWTVDTIYELILVIISMAQCFASNLWIQKE